MEMQDLTDKRRKAIFVNLTLTCVMASLLATALNLALSPIISSFGISAGMGQWLISGYALVLAVAMPLTAYLVSRFPTKRIYLTALGLFIAGLLVCALAPGFPSMMAGRVMQACGNGMIAGTTQTTLLSIFPKSERGRVMGWFGLSVNLAPVAAPPLAGLLVDALGWRSIFWCALCVCCVSFALACTVMRNVLQTVPKRFDVLSFALSTLAFGGLTLGVGNISSFGLAAVPVFIPLAVGILSAVMFAKRQFASEEPLLKLTLLKTPAFAISVLATVVLYFLMMGSNAILPLYLQSGLGHTAFVSSLVLLPGVICMAVVSPYAGSVLDRFGMKRLACVATAVLLAASALLCFLGQTWSLWLIALANALRFAAIGSLTMPFATWGNNNIETRDIAHGSAIQTSLRNVAGALGVAVFVGLSQIGLQSAGPAFGMRLSFAVMTALSAILLAFSLRLKD